MSKRASNPKQPAKPAEPEIIGYRVLKPITFMDQLAGFVYCGPNQIVDSPELIAKLREMQVPLIPCYRPAPIEP